MNRRDTLKAGLMAAILPMQTVKSIAEPIESNYIKPRKLSPGDKCTIIAPGTSVTSPEDLQKVKELMDFLNLKYEIGKNVVSGSGYKTRTIKERTEDLHSAFADKDTKCVMCIRGGYGSAGLLNFIDYKLIKNNPKIFIGYSDITALHLAINKMSGLITYHGPVALSKFNKWTLNSFNLAVFGTEPIGLLKNPVDTTIIRQSHPVRTITSGKATGKLIGGNLSLVCSLMGTKYEMETKGKILLLEDVGEEPYRIDRMLIQVKNAGKLQEASGIVFGECSDCQPSKFSPSTVWDYSLGEVLQNALGDLNIPVFYGLAFGHTDDQFTIPLGVNAVMDANECSLNIIENSNIN